MRAAPASISLSPAALERVYRSMVLIRTFEEHLAARFREGLIPGYIHLSMGHDAIPTGVCAALRPPDLVASTHRGDAHALARGVLAGTILAELMGREGGVCRGRGGSMHLIDVESGFLGGNGIVGGSFGIAAGAALAAAIKGTGQRVDGGDVTAVFAATVAACRRARAGRGP
jgi:TPP-dependent pyruvate/acetoin dehydrogenase alpha subunit